MPPLKRARDWPAVDRFGAQRAVCRSCHLVMTDAEPMGGTEFWHIARRHQTRAARCKHAGKCFDRASKEVEPFLRKARRRALRRANIRA